MERIKEILKNRIDLVLVILWFAFVFALAIYIA